MAQLVGPRVVVGDTEDIHDSALNPLGTRAYDDAGIEYIYLKGLAATAIGTWVTYITGYATKILAQSDEGQVAIASAAVVADKYGWYAVRGLVQGLAEATCSVGTVWIDSVAGRVDDTDSSTNMVLGASCVVLRGSTVGLTEFNINYPHVTGEIVN